MKRIIIAEDHQSLIDGINLLFEHDPNFKIVGMANDGEKLIELVEEKKPDATKGISQANKDTKLN